MRKAGHILLLMTLGASLLVSCQGEMDPGFVASDGIRIEVRGREVFAYDEATCQLGYDSAAGDFRVHTDNMSDFFVVTLPVLPSAEGQTVTGSVRWATAAESGRRDDISLEVVRLDAGTIWLWAPLSRIAVTVRIP